MLEIEGSKTWENKIRLIEAGEPASAGQGAPVNRAAEQLANRTSYLKAQQDNIKQTLANSGLQSGNVAVVVVSDTEPTNLPVGGFWFQPVSEGASGDAIITRDDVATLFNGN